MPQSVPGPDPHPGPRPGPRPQPWTVASTEKLLQGADYHDYRPGPDDPPFPPEPDTLREPPAAPAENLDYWVDPDDTGPVADPDTCISNPVRPPTGDPQPGITRRTLILTPSSHLTDGDANPLTAPAHTNGTHPL